MPIEVKVSQSELNTFRACRRKWWLSYILGLKKREKHGPLALGTNVHEALACYYSPGGTKEEALQTFDDIYTELKNIANEYEIEGVIKDEELGRIMVSGYFDWVEETGADSSIEMVEPEVELEYHTEVNGTPVVIMGRRDVIGFNSLTGTAQLWDHKTTQSFENLGLELVEQPRMYLLLQRLNGSTVVQECVWNLLRKVKRTARAIPPFYKREELYISEDELRYYFVRVRGIIRDILLVREQLEQGEDPHEVCYPRPSRDCEFMCEFRKECPIYDQAPTQFWEMIRDRFETGDPYERYDVKGA